MNMVILNKVHPCVKKAKSDLKDHVKYTMKDNCDPILPLLVQKNTPKDMLYMALFEYKWSIEGSIVGCVTLCPIFLFSQR